MNACSYLQMRPLGHCGCYAAGAAQRRICLLRAAVSRLLVVWPAASRNASGSSRWPAHALRFGNEFGDLGLDCCVLVDQRLGGDSVYSTAVPLQRKQYPRLFPTAVPLPILCANSATAALQREHAYTERSALRTAFASASTAPLSCATDEAISSSRTATEPSCSARIARARACVAAPHTEPSWRSVRVRRQYTSAGGRTTDLYADVDRLVDLVEHLRARLLERRQEHVAETLAERLAQLK